MSFSRVSYVQESNSDKYMYVSFSRLFSLIGYYKILSLVPCAILYVLIVICPFGQQYVQEGLYVLIDQQFHF